MAEEISEDSIRKAIEDNNKVIEDRNRAEREAKRQRPIIEEQARTKAEVDKEKFKREYDSGFLSVARDSLKETLSESKARPGIYSPEYINKIKSGLIEIEGIIRGKKTGSYRVSEANLSEDGYTIEVKYEVKNRLTGKYKKRPKIMIYTTLKGVLDDKYSSEQTYLGITTGRYASTDAIRAVIRKKENEESPEDAVKRAIQMAYGSNIPLDIKKTTFEDEVKQPDGEYKTKTIAGYKIKPKK